MEDKDLEVLELLKKKNKAYYKVMEEFYNDTHSGDFREMENYETMEAHEIVREIIKEMVRC